MSILIFQDLVVNHCIWPIWECYKLYLTSGMPALQWQVTKYPVHKIVPLENSAMPSLSALSDPLANVLPCWENVGTSNKCSWSEGLFLPFAFPLQPSFIKGLWCHSLPSLDTFPSEVCLLPEPLFIHLCWLAPQYLCHALQACNVPMTTSCIYPAMTNRFCPQELCDISSLPCKTSMQALGDVDLAHLSAGPRGWNNSCRSVPDFPWAEEHPSWSWTGHRDPVFSYFLWQQRQMS